ncbi:RNA polymerase inhibitor [Pseudomonas phage vB_PpuP-Mudajogi]|uniref:RNA polymerase inhibitor n=1 Tax=Pseudomonas phage vB_PpuP-Mudajogi TaxID=3132683 RepID=A0AAX4NBX8_9CAUD
MSKRDNKMKLFKATVKVRGEIEEVPVWAESIETALEAADLTYGEDNVYRLRPEVTQ